MLLYNIYGTFVKFEIKLIKLMIVLQKNTL